MFHRSLSQFIHSVVDGHLHCLQFLITNNAAVRILVLAALPWGHFLRSDCPVVCLFCFSCSACHLLVPACEDLTLPGTVSPGKQEGTEMKEDAHIYP